jgi:hypothetical protein
MTTQNTRKYRVYYEDKPGSRDFEVEAPGHRAAAQQFFSQRPRSEHCRIVAESIDWGAYRDFDASEFMDEAQRARASLPPSPAGAAKFTPAQANKWAETRKRGQKYYAIKYGVCWGLLVVILWYVYRIYFDGALNENIYALAGEAIGMVPVTLIAGYMLGKRMWNRREKMYAAANAGRGSFTEGQETGEAGVMKETGEGGVMNKTQKILTVVALVAFSAIIALHYTSVRHGFAFTFPEMVCGRGGCGWSWTDGSPIIEYLPTLLFALGVLYAGTMALTWKRRAQ